MAPVAPVPADPDLSSRLAAAAGNRAGDVAGAVIDIGAATEMRCGFVGMGSSDRAFEIGSVTKCLTGMLLADAINRGEIELRTTVSALQPEAVGTAFGNVTLAQLSTHTSGLPRLPSGAAFLWRALRFACLGRDPYRGLGPDRVYRDAARQRLAQPGRRLYSNLGGALCGQLITRAAGGGDFARLLHERVLAPAGLTGTFVSTGARTARAGHSPLGVSRQPWIMDGYAPAGGVCSTVADLGRLIVGLLTASAPGSES
jgi:CubicO group peptidase (beta-lactamase class C family)